MYSALFIFSGNTKKSTTYFLRSIPTQAMCVSVIGHLLICGVFFISLLDITTAHGCMNFPNPRGSLNNITAHIFNIVDQDAPVDYKPHFPAGSKSNFPLAGLNSQIKAAYPRGWEPFKPLSPSFNWRYGVCGDLKHARIQDHMQNGRYYYGAKIVNTYTSGQNLSIGISINAHHNGYMQFHLCDISKCPSPEISEKCFKTKDACFELQRTPNKLCDSGYSPRCSPVDRNNKGRWYLPCSSFHNEKDDLSITKIERFGYDKEHTIVYSLPSGFHCVHCVLHWFWTSANTCNPPGVVAYFDGPDRPLNWGNCRSQGGGWGGFTRMQKSCDHVRFPEEYVNCADIQILSPHGKHPTPSPISTTSPISSNTSPVSTGKRHPNPIGVNYITELSEADIEQMRSEGLGSIRALILLLNGKRVMALKGYNRLKIKGHVQSIQIESLLEKHEHTQEVKFLINGEVAGFSNGPYQFLLPHRSLKEEWDFNTWIKVTAMCRSGNDSIHILFQNL